VAHLALFFQLVAMGFDRNRALEAYIVFGRNVDAAASSPSSLGSFHSGLIS